MQYFIVEKHSTILYKESMSSPEGGPRPTDFRPLTSDACAYYPPAYSEKRLYPAHEIPLLDEAAANRGFDFTILHEGGDVYVNGGAPINVPDGHILGAFTPIRPNANNWHLRGEIDALRGQALQRASQDVYTASQ
jgi:hypothetical protein